MALLGILFTASRNSFSASDRHLSTRLADEPAVRSKLGSDSITEEQTSADAMRRASASMPDAATDPALEIIVTSSDGRAIEGAIASDQRVPVRELTRDREALLGVSDASGRILVRAEDRRGESTWLVGVSKEGYVPTMVRLDAGEKGPARVMLERGHVQRVHCRFVDGSPAIDHEVVISRSSLSKASRRRSADGTVPAGSPRVAVFRTRTDSSGMASFSGLSVGDYDFWIETTHAAVVEWKPEGGLEVPGGELDVLIGELYAGVFDVIGDEVVSFGATYRQDFVMTGPAYDVVRQTESALEAAFPGRPMAVAVSRRSLADAQVDLKLNLRRKGFLQTKVPLTRFTDGVSPQPIDVTARPDAALGELRVEIFDAAGRPSNVPGFFVSSGGPFLDGLAVELSSQGTVQLPRGTATIQQRHHWMRGRFTPTVAEVPGSLRIQLQDVHRPCKLLVLSGANEELADVALTFELPHARHQVRSGPTSPRTYWLPVGPVTISAMARGCTPASVHVEVEDVGSETVQIVEVPVVPLADDSATDRVR